MCLDKIVAQVQPLDWQTDLHISVLQLTVRSGNQTQRTFQTCAA